MNYDTRDIPFDNTLRPRTFSEFAGQEEVCSSLKLKIHDAQRGDKVLDHILLCGSPGTGKASLACILANAMGVKFKYCSGSKITLTGDLAGLLTTLDAGDILFIHEIDRLAPELSQFLQPAMEDYHLEIVIGDPPELRSVRLNLPKFTLIGATSNEEKISEPVRSRFGMICRLDRYTTLEMQKIVLRTAGILDVPLDPPGALEIATRAQGTPRIANNLLRLAASHLRLKNAISHSNWCELLDVLTHELWALAEARPDFEELPSWVAGMRASGSPVEDANQAAGGIEQIHTILRSVADRYGDEEDQAGFAGIHSQDPGDMALAAADLAQRAATFRKGVRRLPLAIRNDQLLVGRHTRLSFNRTLRIPEDGREYDLPAGFGRLPILRVEDYADRVPEKWLAQGGFIIPLYQREALFLEFAGVQWRPTIAKVSVGRINAISGKEHDLKIRPHRQDYVVIPEQRWLDGINSGDGIVSQFVAMPLGKGYTIEAQITDEEKFGGFQLAIFDPRTGRFPEQDPKEREAAIAALKQRALRAAEEKRGVTILRQEQKTSSLPMFMPKQSGPAFEMGIARGGKIKQQIMEDTYGAESWDEAAFRDVVIHIVNSEVYQHITGREAPPCPITQEQYRSSKIPWYSYYKEKAPTLSPAAVFKRVFSIGQIDKSRGVTEEKVLPRREIQPEEILRIRTSSLEDRWKALLDRAVESSKCGHHRIAAREASFALDLSDKHPLPFFIRALSNHRLGHHSDAEADASACLKLEPDHTGALSIRAYSSLALGEALLAKNDAEAILMSKPDDHDGLYVLAEASLCLGEYGAAVKAAQVLLKSDPADPNALRIKADGLSKLSVPLG